MSIYKVEGVPYPENDDAMTSYIFSYWVSAAEAFFDKWR